ncbi:MAG: tetratricopeptide repeat protein, partial [Flavobacteriales bacterium]|nr:tetratricopeptide repeat protein [Flavobacteriales bacterium]
KAIEYSPKNPDSYMMKAEIYLKLKKHDLACKNLQLARKNQIQNNSTMQKIERMIKDNCK